MEEIWKPIPGYEGIYEASSLGRIRSAPGKTTSNARFTRREWKTRVLKPKRETSAREDERVSLWRDGQKKDYLVARLVAAAWYGAPADGMTVNHKNGNYLDNRPSNLEWVSLADNIRHGFSTGLFSSVQKPVVLAGNGEETAFDSMAEASRFLGRCSQYVSGAVAKRKPYVSSITGEIYRVSF